MLSASARTAEIDIGPALCVLLDDLRASRGDRSCIAREFIATYAWYYKHSLEGVNYIRASQEAVIETINR